MEFSDIEAVLSERLKKAESAEARLRMYVSITEPSLHKSFL